jgi:hypothetical protein
MVRLAVNWEVRLRGNEQREGAFLKVMLDVRAVERVGHWACRSTSSSGGDGTMHANVAIFMK